MPDEDLPLLREDDPLYEELGQGCRVNARASEDWEFIVLNDQVRIPKTSVSMEFYRTLGAEHGRRKEISNVSFYLKRDLEGSYQGSYHREPAQEYIPDLQEIINWRPEKNHFSQNRKALQGWVNQPNKNHLNPNEEGRYFEKIQKKYLPDMNR